MDMQDKIEKYVLNRLSESERADFEIEMHLNPLLKDQVELEQAIVNQIHVRAFVDKQIEQAREEMRHEKYEKYLFGQMIETERAEFENELQNNSLLKEQLELEQVSVTQIQKRAFVGEQKNAAKREMQGGKTIRMTFFSVVSVAAMFLLVFLIHGVWQGRQYDQLYASNFVTYTNDYLTTNGAYRGDIEIDSLQVVAMTAYEKKEFASAETQFVRILSAKDNSEIRFYLGMTQLETGKTNDALKTLRALYTLPHEYKYYEQARWYLALVYLKLHQNTEAKEYLNELVVLEGVYWDKAKELMHKI